MALFTNDRKASGSFFCYNKYLSRSSKLERVCCSTGRVLSVFFLKNCKLVKLFSVLMTLITTGEVGVKFKQTLKSIINQTKLADHYWKFSSSLNTKRDLLLFNVLHNSDELRQKPSPQTARMGLGYCFFSKDEISQLFQDWTGPGLQHAMNQLLLANLT